MFDYSAEAPLSSPAQATPDPPSSEAAPLPAKALAPLHALEGAGDDPTFTKVVDRRWYQRNKHIYPASTWQEFDPEKDYQQEIRRDPGGNAFFFSG